MHHGITHEQCSALAVGQSGGLCLASGVNCSFKKNYFESRVSSTETYNEDYRDKQQRESNNVTVNTTPPKKKEGC